MRLRGGYGSVGGIKIGLIQRGINGRQNRVFFDWRTKVDWFAGGVLAELQDLPGDLGADVDRIQRLNTKTGETVEYLMPRDTNVRRVFVDNSTSPVTFWTGNNHSASIVRVEPQD